MCLEALDVCEGYISSLFSKNEVRLTRKGFGSAPSIQFLVKELNHNVVQSRDRAFEGHSFWSDTRNGLILDFLV